jgi:hypothetical protein
MANKKSTKAELKKYCVTETIYVSIDVLAKSETDAEKIFESIKLDQYDYQQLVADSMSEIEVQQYE